MAAPRKAPSEDSHANIQWQDQLLWISKAGASDPLSTAQIAMLPEQACIGLGHLASRQENLVMIMIY